MQAIVTKYHGPTNTRPGRVSAKCEAARVIVEWDHALNVDDNHRRAAETLRDKLGWTQAAGYPPMHLGCLPQNVGGYVLVFEER